MSDGQTPGGQGLGRMHAGEVATSAGQVRRLVAGQFPAWAGLPVTPVPSAGTDNAIYRLGEGLAVRLPRVARAVPQVEKERRWLPLLAPRLPLAVPEPLALGAPGEGYPFSWSVCRWLPGASALDAALAEPARAARDLAAFITSLQGADTTGGPPAGAHNFGRGLPLAQRDGAVRSAIAALGARIDAAAVTAAWEEALAAPLWPGPPVWVHGDLMAGNLLVTGGQLSAVIDFGGLGVGDPAVDLLPAWMLFSGAARAAFRAALGVDDAAWARGRGWALSVALIALPYYLHTNPGIVAQSWHTLRAVLAR